MSEYVKYFFLYHDCIVLILIAKEKNRGKEQKGREEKEQEVSL